MKDNQVGGLVRSIATIRANHSCAWETATLVNDIFQTLLLLLLAYVLTLTVSFLYYAVLWQRLALTPPQALYMAQGAAAGAGTAAAVAWASGAAVAEGAERADAAAAALLLAARGFPAAEREAQLLLAQRRAQRVRFTAGGLFPLDLRFFVSWFGTVAAYLVVVVQFTPPLATAGESPLIANCSTARKE
ncbi:hypothetical protein R5R35_006974 [Gryllus longicercus]|uniref:Gustatory receptor n=1 Tax=Gryllus longicercus TaxID=2509291 RepID=A0AAN9W537_9ORTH